MHTAIIIFLSLYRCFLGKYNDIIDDSTLKENRITNKSNCKLKKHNKNKNSELMMRSFPKNSKKMNASSDEFQSNAESSVELTNAEEHDEQKESKKPEMRHVKTIPINVADAVDAAAILEINRDLPHNRSNSSKQNTLVKKNRRKIAALHSKGHSKKGTIEKLKNNGSSSLKRKNNRGHFFEERIPENETDYENEAKPEYEDDVKDGDKTKERPDNNENNDDLYNNRPNYNDTDGTTERPNYNDGTTERPNYNDGTTERPNYNNETGGSGFFDDNKDNNEIGGEGLYNGNNNFDENEDAGASSYPSKSSQKRSCHSKSYPRKKQKGDTCFSEPNDGLQEQLGDIEPEDFDWSPIIRKIVIPATPREILMLKIVPVPVTKDGKLWKLHSC